MTHDAVTPAARPDAAAPAAENRPAPGAGPAADVLAEGRAHLGLELGSTRIKAALVDDAGTLLATGSHAWENQLVDDSWTYSLDAVHEGIRACFADLARDVQDRHGVTLRALASIGISAMMHGYLVFDAEGRQLAPFRTWRNTYTTDAAAELSEAFGVNIPLRWSVAHLLHAVRGGEEHVRDIAELTTLAGYVHRELTGRRVLGVGDASGMFPIAPGGDAYDPALLARFAALDGVEEMPWSLEEILPEVLTAGEDAGTLTAAGAALLDPTGTLQPGALAAAPEGDAGTGMVATQAIAPRTGNVSAGTSAFAMVVLERPLSGPREEIDLVTTPAGDPVAMIHTNNCAGDLDAWLGLFGRFAELLGHEVAAEELYQVLFGAGADGEAHAGGILTYNYLSGEHQTGVDSGRPLLVREQTARFTLENFMRAQLYGAFGALAVGMEALLEGEGVELDVMFAHGGIFRTAGVAQQVLADAIGTPVAVGASAGEGGAWGMALLAAYTARRAGSSADGGAPHAPSTDGAAPTDGTAATTGAAETLAEFLAAEIFAGQELSTLAPQEAGRAGHARWLAGYRAGLPVERLAGELLD